MTNYLAKTSIKNNPNQQTGLKEHLITTYHFGKALQQKLGIKNDNNLCLKIDLACLLHDVGKIEARLQSFFNGSKTEVKPYHNELSWAYVNTYMKDEIIRQIGSPIYWHHATYFNANEIEKRNKKNFFEDNDKGKQQKTIFYDSIESFIQIELFQDNHIKNDVKDFYLTHLKENPKIKSGISGKVPKLYYYDDDNEIDETFNELNLTLTFPFIIRGILQAADWLASEYNEKHLEIPTIEECVKFINDQLLIFKKFNIYNEIQKPENYDDRFDKQRQIVKDLSLNTSVIKAPAGFGKTMIGLLSLLEKEQQTFWVLPTNTTARSVYNNLLKEIEALQLSNNDVSIELWLTSTRQEASDENIANCKSRIVVTNIDNLQKSFVNSSEITLRTILSSYIIFDEFHEFLADNPLFGTFIILMNARNCYFNNVQTICLSATPGLIHELWDGTYNNKTKLLPNQQEHYPAQHEKEYLLHTSNINPIYAKEENLPIIQNLITNSSTLCIYNGVKSTQNHYKLFYNQVDELVHGKFLKSEKERKIQKVCNEIFAKDLQKRSSIKQNVISTNILTSAHDFSADNLCISLCSPEQLLQAIGRINRYGYNDNAQINIFHDCVNDENEETNKKSKKNKKDKKIQHLKKDRTESSFIANVYDTKLFQKIFECLKQFNGQTKTLNELYKIYNQFLDENKDDILTFYRKLFKDSIKSLSGFILKRTFKKDENTIKNNVITSVKTLRGDDNIFIVVKDENGKWCAEPFSYGRKDYDNYTDILDKLQLPSETTIQELEKLGFDYSSIPQQNRKAIYKFKKAAKCNISPFPVEDSDMASYDTKIGLSDKLKGN